MSYLMIKVIMTKNSLYIYIDADFNYVSFFFFLCNNVTRLFEYLTIHVDKRTSHVSLSRRNRECEFAWIKRRARETLGAQIWRSGDPAILHKCRSYKNPVSLRSKFCLSNGASTVMCQRIM